MTFVFLLASIVLAAMIVALLVSSQKINGEVRSLAMKLSELESSSSDMTSKAAGARDQLEQVDKEVKAMRSELKAEIEARGKL